MRQVSPPRDLAIYPLAERAVLVLQILRGFVVTLVLDRVDEPRGFLLYLPVLFHVEKGMRSGLEPGIERSWLGQKQNYFDGDASGRQSRSISLLRIAEGIDQSTGFS